MSAKEQKKHCSAAPNTIIRAAEGGKQNEKNDALALPCPHPGDAAFDRPGGSSISHA